MNSPCLPVEALREPDIGGRTAALIRRHVTGDRQARGSPDGVNILGLSSVEEAALDAPRQASSLRGEVLPLRAAKNICVDIRQRKTCGPRRVCRVDMSNSDPY
jgi:hypothetical protein